jgi:hypothetical protein
MMSQIVEPAKAGAHGFDANTPLTKAKAAALKQAGFAFAVRYLTRKATPPAGDLSKAEVAAILDSGLALMAVQHVAAAGWTPSAALGAEYGANAAAHARAVGLPPGTAVFLDLEEVDAKTAPADIIAYCNTWHDALASAGYVPGLYVGSNCGLSGEQLYRRLKMTHYWKSGSKVPALPQRGYSMVQTIRKDDVVAGIAIDRNLVTPDAFGATPPWARAAGAAPLNCPAGEGAAGSLRAVRREAAPPSPPSPPAARRR